RDVGCVILPSSEGSASRWHGAVALQLLHHALRRCPLLFSLGTGVARNPYPRFLRAMGWTLDRVPFYFRVVRPAAFFRSFQPLRRTRPGRALLDAAAASRTGAWAL